ncbi:hypothetical protein D9M70_516250 [compost metagenome]
MPAGATRPAFPQEGHPMGALFALAALARGQHPILLRRRIARFCHTCGCYASRLRSRIPSRRRHRPAQCAIERAAPAGRLHPAPLRGAAGLGAGADRRIARLRPQPRPARCRRAGAIGGTPRWPDRAADPAQRQPERACRADQLPGRQAGAVGHEPHRHGAARNGRRGGPGARLRGSAGRVA